MPPFLHASLNAIRILEFYFPDVGHAGTHHKDDNGVSLLPTHFLGGQHYTQNDAYLGATPARIAVVSPSTLLVKTPNRETGERYTYPQHTSLKKNSERASLAGLAGRMLQQETVLVANYSLPSPTARNLRTTRAAAASRNGYPGRFSCPRGFGESASYVEVAC